MTIGVWDFLLMLLVAAIIGAIGEAVAGYSAGGCALSTIIGFVGAFIGNYLRALLHLPHFWRVPVGTAQFDIIWSIIGAALLVLVLRLVLGRRAVN